MVGKVAVVGRELRLGRVVAQQARLAVVVVAKPHQPAAVEHQPVHAFERTAHALYHELAVVVGYPLAIGGELKERRRRADAVGKPQVSVGCEPHGSHFHVFLVAFIYGGCRPERTVVDGVFVDELAVAVLIKPRLPAGKDMRRVGRVDVAGEDPDETVAYSVLDVVLKHSPFAIFEHLHAGLVLKVGHAVGCVQPSALEHKEAHVVVVWAAGGER